MSYPLVNAAISQVVYDTQVKTVIEFKAFLESKLIDVSDLESEFSEFLSSLKILVVPVVAEKKGREKTIKAEPAKKKQPTLFNLFVKEKMASLKVDNPDKKGKEILSMASEAWKSDPFAIFLKENQTTLKEENPDATNELIYEKAKEQYGGENIVVHIVQVETPKNSPKPKSVKVPKAPKKGKKPLKSESSDDDMGN